jgi:hypothetical protein
MKAAYETVTSGEAVASASRSVVLVEDKVVPRGCHEFINYNQQAAVAYSTINFTVSKTAARSLAGCLLVVGLEILHFVLAGFPVYHVVVESFLLLPPQTQTY